MALRKPKTERIDEQNRSNVTFWSCSFHETKAKNKARNTSPKTRKQKKKERKQGRKKENNNRERDMQAKEKEGETLKISLKTKTNQKNTKQPKHTNKNQEGLGPSEVPRRPPTQHAPNKTHLRANFGPTTRNGRKCKFCHVCPHMENIVLSAPTQTNS